MNKVLAVIALLLSSNVIASQDAPNDPYAMQCFDGKCYYVTGKQVPAAVLAKFEKELAQQEKEENDADK